MAACIQFGTYWIFQILNTVTALGLFIAPRAFHESLFAEPQRVYALLGFSDTALSMLHNVLRGQGAALLAVSLFLFVGRAQSRRAFLLIALVCGLALIAHLGTLHHHLQSEIVRQAVGGLNSLYGMIAVNALIALGALWTYRRLRPEAGR